MAKQSLEPVIWMLFGAGGVLSALFFPAIVVLFGLAFPLGWLTPPSHAQLLGMLQNPLTRLALLVLCSLSLVHGAHRLRYTLYDGLQIKHLNELINTACYGGAIVGSLVAAYLLIVAI